MPGSRPACKAILSAFLKASSLSCSVSNTSWSRDSAQNSCATSRAKAYRKVSASVKVWATHTTRQMHSSTERKRTATFSYSEHFTSSQLCILVVSTVLVAMPAVLAVAWKHRLYSARTSAVLPARPSPTTMSWARRHGIDVSDSSMCVHHLSYGYGCAEA